MRTAIYVRVACATQSQPSPIERQLDRLSAHLVAGGEEVTDEHIFRDEGHSGVTLDRPALNRLREHVRLGEYERILVTEPSRLSRDHALLAVLFTEFRRAGCRIESPRLYG
jgi:site-specific DNA recombinase